MVQIHAISIQLHLLHTKDTESHEDSDFCYDWGGVRMCDFCKSGKRDIILNDDGSIICLTADTVVAIDRDTGKKHKNQIAINYCPICGRKLVEE